MLSGANASWNMTFSWMLSLKDILEHFCNRTQSQYGMVAIISANMVLVKREIWKAFLEFRSNFFAQESTKSKNSELQEEVNLKKKQLSTKDFKVLLAACWFVLGRFCSTNFYLKNFQCGFFPYYTKKIKHLSQTVSFFLYFSRIPDEYLIKVSLIILKQIMINKSGTSSNDYL